ncbi:MAG: FtsX-like permease family protein [Betaproteobacteria bacterium]|nr:FtsX-like permease family protein [Betaproteobacteria bacterium]
MIFSLLREALRSMAGNRMRTFLTMLGLVIGVGAVVLMAAIGAGAQSQVELAIQSMGSNLFIVLPGSSTASGVRSGSGGASTLTGADAQAIAELPAVAAVAPLFPGSGQVVYGAANWSTQVLGVTPSYFEVRGWRIEQGYAFADTDLRAMARVALLGGTVARQLFGEESPVGKTVRIRNAPFTVVGTLAAKGQSFDGRDQDDTVLVPLTTARRKLFGSPFPDAVRMIMVQAVSGDTMASAERSMGGLLRERHRIPPQGEPDFMIRNLSAAADVQAQTTKVMSMMLGAVASISLVVGGIGIMNIMLVSVTERTREIGIRMAVGARRRDVLLQFLLEALVVSVMGGVIGVGLGIGCAYLVSQTAGTFVVVTLASVALAFAVAAAVGVFFGFYPARKASLLKPIEALRYQ